MGVQNLPPRVVSSSKTLYFLKILVIPMKRWLCPDMPENLLTGTLSLNKNKQKQSVESKVLNPKFALGSFYQ